MRCLIQRLALAALVLASCYRDRDGCRRGSDDDDGEPEPADTCKPGDESCHGAVETTPR